MVPPPFPLNGLPSGAELLDYASSCASPMASLELRVGDVVVETYHGHYSHREYHGDQNLRANVAGLPLNSLIRKPKLLWRPRKGTVLEVQARWWGQGGHDVKVQWKDGGEPEWRLADTEHLSLVKRAPTAKS